MKESPIDVDKVTIEHSPADDKLYVNPAIGIQMTGASKSIRGFYGPLRQAGAAARTMLVTAGAQRWAVEPSTCRAEDGVVMHPASGRKLAYDALVDAAAKLPVPEKVTLKDPAQFKLIGTPHRRLDSAGKVNGTAKFGIDARPTGMKFAVLASSRSGRRRGRRSGISLPVQDRDAAAQPCSPGREAILRSSSALPGHGAPLP